jgi:hypothetical protein
MLRENGWPFDKLTTSVDGVVEERFVAAIGDRGSQKAEVNDLG